MAFENVKFGVPAMLVQRNVENDKWQKLTMDIYTFNSLFSREMKAAYSAPKTISITPVKAVGVVVRKRRDTL